MVSMRNNASESPGMPFCNEAGLSRNDDRDQQAVLAPIVIPMRGHILKELVGPLQLLQHAMVQVP